MTTDNRKILRSVRVGNETITDVDKLDEAATPEQIARLKKNGDITGNFKGTKRAASKDEAKK